MKDVLKTVAIADITVSATNPRNHYDETALKELSQSIEQIGVLQPVLLRPKGKKYELVCGERRYRASKMAGKKTIPANIRDLTDEEAFEAQIIENLERKDVHPLDEALAFKSMLDSQRYTMQDIAAKVVKPETFIAQRLKLNDLVPEVKKDFFNGEIGVGHAVLIARLSSESQNELYTNYKDNSVTGYGTVKQLENEIKTESLDLEEAPFPLDVSFKCAIPCVQCPKRTVNNPVLFPDMQEEDSCLDKNCYRQKLEEHTQLRVRAILESGSKVLLGFDYNSKPSVEVQKMADEYEVKLHRANIDFKTWDITKAKEEQMLIVSGNKKGFVVTVWFPIESKPNTPTNIPVTNYTEIDRLKDRAKRDLELDKQKVQLKIIEQLKAQFDKEVELPFIINDKGRQALFIFLALNSEWWVLKPRLERMGYNLKLEGKTTKEAINEIMALTSHQKTQILAFVLFHHCKSGTTGEGLFSDIIRELAICNSEIDVAAIDKEQQEIAEARIARTNAKLAELENKTTKK